MALSVATLIDRGKALADRRNDASIPDADWLTYVNWAVEDLYRFLVSIDPGTYFQTIDFSLAGGINGSTFNLDPYFDVRLIATSLPAFTASLGPGPGRTLTANANGILSVDGTVTLVGDRILYSAASASAGIYMVSVVGTAGTPFVLVRATDFDQFAPTEIQIGAVVQASAGATLAGTPFVLTALPAIIDTSVMTWTNIPLYTRFRSLHGVDISPDTTSRRTVGRRNFRERNQGAIGPWYPAPWAPDRRYDLRGSLLVITPYETAAGLYRAYYRAAPYKWSTPTDTDRLDPQLEVYDEYLAHATARRGLAIEESDTSVLDQRISELKQSISAEHQRDDEPAVLADVEVDVGTRVVAMSQTNLPRPPASLDEILVAIEQALQALENHPLAGLKLIGPVTFAGAYPATTRVYHGLGQRPQGYFVVNTVNSFGLLTEVANPTEPDPSNFITLAYGAATGGVLIAVY